MSRTQRRRSRPGSPEDVLPRSLPIPDRGPEASEGPGSNLSFLVPATVVLMMAIGAATAPEEVAAQQPTVTVELEAGPVWQSYNDVEIPNDGTATRFSLYDLAGAGPWPGGRVYVTWHLNDRHSLRGLAAPFSLTETGVPGQEIRFAGRTYRSGVPAEATYTFNSYRLGYRYRAHSGDRTTAWVGFTAKIRDATIALRQDGVSSRKDDLGFVPLLHLDGDWRFAEPWRLSLEAEGLAGGPGRAVDAALEIAYDRERWSVEAGYRTIEGGADVSDVYTFAWLHFATVSLIWRW